VIALGILLILLGAFSIIDGILDFVARLGCGLLVLSAIFVVISAILELVSGVFS
jgi:hypothetical protein